MLVFNMLKNISSLQLQGFSLCFFLLTPPYYDIKFRAMIKTSLLYICIISLLFSCCYHAHSEPDEGGDDDPGSTLERRFENWQIRYNRHYRDQKEWELRFKIYKENLKHIEEVNSKNLSYQLGDNKFADLTNQEFNSLYVGKLTNSSLGQHTLLPNKSSSPRDLPPTFDWRDQGALNPIKDQGECGSCWAFTTVATIEAITKIASGNTISLSEQQLVDCDLTEVTRGCNGGSVPDAFQFVIDSGGLATDTDYAYTAVQGPCQDFPSAATISSFTTLPPLDENALQEAVTKQPVAVYVDAGGPDFQTYTSGIINACTTQVNHGVVLVGYGEEDGRQFWVVRNSWGTGWGEEGYARIERGNGIPEGTCGILQNGYFPAA